MTGADSSSPMISGSVERITYYNEENGYTVLRLRPDRREMLPYRYATGREGLITVIGHLPEINPGEWLKLTGRWETHAQHGRQFRADRCEQAMPATIEGIKRYLGSGLVRGVGRVMAERIVDAFGEETLDIIDEEPDRLATVAGIGPKRVKGIIRAWEEQRAIRDVMLFLQSHGVSTSLATKIYKKYGDEALPIVQRTPYRLVADIHGVGFLTADRIARALGIEQEDPGRIEAGIAFTLNQKTQEGHVYVPQNELEPSAAEILEVGEEKVRYVIDSLASEALITREILEEAASESDGSEPDHEKATAVYLTPLYFAEVGVARRVQQLLTHPSSRLEGRPTTPQGILPLRQRPLPAPGSHPLSVEQQQAVETALTHKVTILTGGPGTGKTTTLRALLDTLDARGHSYALASPTGRAAKRLGEATGRPAKTIHRLLEFKPGEGFGRHQQNPIEADIVIIDETSMLDVALANNLVKAVDPASHLLLVGDVDQLPSVGAGDVLRDLIKSGVPAVVRLRTIFRQAQNSLIVRNAHRINRGEMPQTGSQRGDFFIFVKEDPEELADLIVDIVRRRVPARFGFDSFDGIQVLSPMYQGAAGVSRLNDKLQAGLNPAGRKAEQRLGGRLFRIGDKILQTVNNYDKNVFNGDIGRITAIDPVQQTIKINMDGLPVVYDFLEMDELVHAYAISVHKSQGSEYPCVVIPVSTQHYMMLQRNLLYTAVTRAQKLVILAGTRRAIAIAVKNNRVAERFSGLAERLRRGVALQDNRNP